MQVVEKGPVLARLRLAPRCIFSNSRCIFPKKQEDSAPETGSPLTVSSARQSGLLADFSWSVKIVYLPAG